MEPANSVRDQSEALPTDVVEQYRCHAVNEIGSAPVNGLPAGFLSHEDPWSSELALEGGSDLLATAFGTEDRPWNNDNPPFNRATKMGAFKLHKHIFRVSPWWPREMR
jgi:hypothetical protein